MSSTNNSPAPAGAGRRAISIDWSWLGLRLKRYAGQIMTSLRHKLGQTEYTPPAWMERFRFTWFRLGLIGLAIFVFTNKQVDFTISVGKEGFAAGQSQGRHSAVQTGGPGTLQVVPASLGGIASTSGNAVGAAPADGWSVDQLDAERVRAYVNRFRKVAQGEEVKFSIPAPANMALAIIHSEAGTNAAAKRDNNHFGQITNGDYYDNAWSNWRAHSELVNKRYPALADNSVNYQQWVAAMAKTNYSSDRALANKVMAVVERFDLAGL